MEILRTDLDTVDPVSRGGVKFESRCLLNTGQDTIRINIWLSHDMFLPFKASCWLKWVSSLLKQTVMMTKY